MSPTEADSFVDATAAYVHIPFCSAVCPYCDFAVVAGRDHLAYRYVDAVCAEIATAEPWRPLQSVYFGGGTPTHVDPALLARILDALETKHGVEVGAEISIEANPEDFSSDRAHHLREIGFNRVSFGAQSFDNQLLGILGRRHTASDVEQSINAARTAGFDNVSIDLIYGTPAESQRSWETSLARAVGLDPDHISCYALTVERGTSLGRAVAAGASAPDPDLQAERYELADRILAEAGYLRYEVSNWSRPDRECRYNMTVWAQGEYEAYGNGAHGFRGKRRFHNVRRLEAYLERIESTGSARSGDDLITGWDAELDRLFVGLRRLAGVSHGPGTTTLLESDDGQALVRARVLESTSDRLKVVRPLMTDAVHRSLLGLSRPIVLVGNDA